MQALAQLVQANPAVWLASGGFIIGMAFGAIVYRTNFCTMGAISDAVTFGDRRRLRSWLLAAATALIGTQSLAAFGHLPITRAMYLSPNLAWVTNILGGLMFGYGMVFAGGCASRNVARAGSGDLRAFFTLIIMGLVAYMSIGGIIGPARSWLEQATSFDLKRLQLGTQGLGEFVGVFGRVGIAKGNLVVSSLLAGGALAYCFSNKAFRASRVHVLAGLGVGLCTVAGWLLTGLAFDDLADKPVAPISLTFVRPTADAIEWLERFTADRMPGFGVATVFGALLGSFLAAKAMGRFRLITFSDVNDTKRSLFGASLMGIGGVMALGCTVGQAITGMSTLAAGSLLTFVSIVVGGVWGIKSLEAAIMKEA